MTIRTKNGLPCFRLSRRALGSLVLLAATLFAKAQTNFDVQIGVGATFRQRGGTNEVVRQLGGGNEVSGDLMLLSGARYELLDGSLLCSNLFARSDPFVFGPWSTQFQQIGGLVEVGKEIRMGRFCSLDLQSGTITTRDFIMEAGSAIGQKGGVIRSSGTFVMDSGYFRTAGQQAWLGQLRVTNAFLGYADPSPTIVFGTNNPCPVRFADSRMQAWHAEALLDIENWDGSTNGEGRTTLSFGTNANGLTTFQLSRIRFRDPAGLAQGFYYARMLSTGEVVPTAQPTLVSFRSSRAVLLDWDGLFTLQMATNVTGPYLDLPGVQAPFTNSQKPDLQFFRLRGTYP